MHKSIEYGHSKGDDIWCTKYSIEYGHNKGDDIWCTNLSTMDILMVMTFGAQKLSGHILLNKKLRQKDRHQDK